MILRPILFLLGDSSVNTQTSVSGQRGHAVGISLGVIVVVTGAICIGAFLLFRRHLKKKRPQLLMQESAEETHPLELEDDIDTTKPGCNHIFHYVVSRRVTGTTKVFKNC